MSSMTLGSPTDAPTGAALPAAVVEDLVDALADRCVGSHFCRLF